MKTRIRSRNIQIFGESTGLVTIKAEFVVRQDPKKVVDPKYAAIQKLWDYFYNFDAEVNLLGDEEH